LRDRLPLGDGKRIILIGLRPKTRVDEKVPGNLSHGVEDSRVGDVPGSELNLHHGLPLFFVIGIVLIAETGERNEDGDEGKKRCEEDSPGHDIIR
jgi:hypothetical protein